LVDTVRRVRVLVLGSPIDHAFQCLVKSATPINNGHKVGVQSISEVGHEDKHTITGLVDTISIPNGGVSLLHHEDDICVFRFTDR